MPRPRERTSLFAAAGMSPRCPCRAVNQSWAAPASVEQRQSKEANLLHGGLTHTAPAETPGGLRGPGVPCRDGEQGRVHPTCSCGARQLPTVKSNSVPCVSGATREKRQAWQSEHYHRRRPGYGATPPSQVHNAKRLTLEPNCVTTARTGPKVTWGHNHGATFCGGHPATCDPVWQAQAQPHRPTIWQEHHLLRSVSG